MSVTDVRTALRRVEDAKNAFLNTPEHDEEASRAAYAEYSNARQNLSDAVRDAENDREDDGDESAEVDGDETRDALTDAENDREGDGDESAEVDGDETRDALTDAELTGQDEQPSDGEQKNPDPLRL